MEIFREWYGCSVTLPWSILHSADISRLQGQVTDLETEAGTPLPILNPSVRVILLAHSAGLVDLCLVFSCTYDTDAPAHSGLVASDTLFSVLDHRPVSADPDVKLMFPLIHGLMAFDTPYNGLSRSMFAYGAFSQYHNLSSIWSIGTSVGALLSSGGTALASTQGPSWKRWQLLASRTGTYGAIIAGGVAAYANRAEIAQSLSKLNKEKISDSWSKANRENLYQGISRVPTYVSRNSIGEGFAWIASHLKFVGALMKQAQLKTRLERLSHLKGIGVVNVYTSLGDNGYWTGGYFVPKRTFCAIPTAAEEFQIFREQPNTEASDEIAAHCSMFRPDKNPKYEEMAEASRDMVLDWLKNDPRNVLDDYKPSQGQRERSMSEAQQWDDDGNVLGSSEGGKDGNEDEWQLQAILNAQGMPEPADGGISNEDLKKAAELPLPAEEVSGEAMKQLWDGDGDPPKSWASRISRPFSGISMPAMPSIPAVHIPGRGKHDGANGGDKTSEQGTETKVPKGKVREEGEIDKGVQEDT